MGLKASFGKGIKHYTYPEMFQQHTQLKKKYPSSECKIKMGIGRAFLRLRPTEHSIEYTIRMDSKVGRKMVDVFVIEPCVTLYWEGKEVPHLYPSDGSLCLYYPEYGEWNYTNSWADTLIPWTSLWLFYYELWQETGEWLGGGIHVIKKQ